LSARFLPPEPAGPEPDLGDRAAPQATEPLQQQASPAHQPPPQRQAPPPAGWAPPSPGPSPGPWQPPPPGWQPGQAQWSWQAQPQPPANNPAVVGFVLAVTGPALLVVSFGLSSIFSALCSGFAILYSLRGRRRVDQGLTPQHRGLAQAGFIIGIVGLILALFATAGWIALLSNEEFRDDIEREFDDRDGGGGDGFETNLRLAAAVARVGLAAVAGA
jgi:hypothetical protein